MTDFVCDCCGHEDTYTSWLRERWSEPAGWSCPYCRAWYSVRRGSASLIRGADVPLGDERAGAHQGIWHPASNLPIHHGFYEVELRDGSVTRMLYDSISFVTDSGERVYPYRWRGMWPRS